MSNTEPDNTIWADEDSDPIACVRQAEAEFGQILGVFVICRNPDQDPEEGRLRLWLDESIRRPEHYQWIDAQLRKAVTLNEMVRTAAEGKEAGSA